MFAFQFFGAQVAALAALYNIPYYAGILAIRRIANISNDKNKENNSKNAGT